MATIHSRVDELRDVFVRDSCRKDGLTLLQGRVNMVFRNARIKIRTFAFLSQKYSPRSPAFSQCSARARPQMRNKRLDILRCIAVITVILHHSGESSFFTRVGWIGVDLFFVLSGFLISGLLFSEYKKRHSISLKRFFIRRGLKIYPAFYAFLLLTGVIGGWFFTRIQLVGSISMKLFS